MKSPKILVVGAGAIGGVTAAMLAKNGYDVSIICKYPQLVQKIEQEGLELRGQQGLHKVKMPAFATAADVNFAPDWVLLATKATDMMAPVHDLLPKLHKNSLIISMQNGICEDTIASVVGRERVIGCVVGWGATMLDKGVLEMTSSGEFVIGNIDHQEDERLLPIQKALNHVVPVEISPYIMGHLYSKLIINACITSLGAICGLYLGEMLKQKKIRQIFIKIMEEAMAVANAMQLKIPPYANKLDYYKFLKKGSFIANFTRHLTIRVIGMKYKKLKSSSLQSLERGKPTEIDFLNGYICQKGKEHRILTPMNNLIVATIKEIESGKRKIGLHNFEEKGFFELI